MPDPGYRFRCDQASSLEYSLYFQDTPDSFAIGAFEKPIEGHGHLTGSHKIVLPVPTRNRARCPDLQRIELLAQIRLDGCNSSA